MATVRRSIAMAWSGAARPATDPAAGSEPFNITNGDILRWQDMWPTIADYFKMKTAQPQKIDLIHMMADKESLWDCLAREHRLQPIPYEELVRWSYGNFVFTPEFDIISYNPPRRRRDIVLPRFRTARKCSCTTWMNFVQIGSFPDMPRFSLFDRFGATPVDVPAGVSPYHHNTKRSRRAVRDVTVLWFTARQDSLSAAWPRSAPL